MWGWGGATRTCAGWCTWGYRGGWRGGCENCPTGGLNLCTYGKEDWTREGFFTGCVGTKLTGGAELGGQILID